MITPPEPRLIILTPAQRAALGELTRDGASNGEIAERLHIGAGTVRNHLHAVHQATGISDRTAMVVAFRNGRFRVRTVARVRQARDAA